jgi:L-ribulose-5-phosphate 4-epimerase
VIRLDGTVAEGDLAEMSPEVVAVHTGVYRARSRTGAVIHTHSPHLLAFALAQRPLPARYEPPRRPGQAEEVPVAPFNRGHHQADRGAAELRAAALG